MTKIFSLVYRVSSSMCASEAKPLQLLENINYNGPVKNIYWFCSTSGGAHKGKCRRPRLFAKKEEGAVKRNLPVCWEMKLLG